VYKLAPKLSAPPSRPEPAKEAAKNETGVKRPAPVASTGLFKDSAKTSDVSKIFAIDDDEARLPSNSLRPVSSILTSRSPKTPSN
jgi:hypothetical protein